MLTVQNLLDRTNAQVQDHVPLHDPIPVLAGLQAQGDVAVIPSALLPKVRPVGAPRPVPPAGTVVVSGTHDHIVVADTPDGHSTVTLTDATDSEGLAVAILTASAPCWLLHTGEHGGTGIAAGTYVLRRQREQADVQRLVAD